MFAKYPKFRKDEIIFPKTDVFYSRENNSELFIDQ